MIRAWLMMLWGRVWPYIAALGAALGAVLAIRQSGKRAGRQEAEREQANAASEQRRKTNVVDSQMAQMGDDDVRRDLAKWVQPADTEDR